MGARLALGGDLTDPLVLLLRGIGGFGPTLAAHALRLAGRRGARQARVRAVGRWAPAAILIGVTPLTLAALVAGGADADVVVAGGGLVPLLVLQLIMVSAEEFGWRGHAQPRLRRALPPVRAALTVGII